MTEEDIPTAEECSAIETVARYQFGLEPDVDFLPAESSLRVLRSRSGRVDRLYLEEERICTLTTAGRLTLGVAGARRLHAITTPPAYRVSLEEEAIPFVKDGRNAFAKFVIGVDQRIRPRDEVLIVDVNDRLVAVGRAELAATGMQAFERGMAASIRHGITD